MSDIVIRVDELGKRYRIGAQQESYRTLRETLVDAAGAPIRRLIGAFKGRTPGQSERIIWALKDVSFEVKQGEVVGFIGRNGAGKTTLFKVLSRITKPTEGSVDLWGRVGSLLEVGTGFHPELTGRENIYLNGAILGMRRAEIGGRFEEIVAFAETEKFLDTPVKHYSSGMYVRLAFAVAAHMEPEILIVDEVLAVGDAAFQRKCIELMSETARQGRTVLVVSHNMASIQRLCSRAMLLESGKLVLDDQVASVVSKYLSQTDSKMYAVDGDRLLRSREPHSPNRITYFRIDTANRPNARTILSGNDIDLIFGCKCREADKQILLSFVVKNRFGQQLFLQHNQLEGRELRTEIGTTEIVCRVLALPLPAADYNLYVQLWVDGVLVDETDTDWFSVLPGDYFSTGQKIEAANALLLVRGEWSQRAALIGFDREVEE